MANKEYEEELAVRIITDHLNIQIKNNRNLTQEEEPPDYYFEIGDRKIGCEVTHFAPTHQLAKEIGDKHKIVKGIQRSLQEKGIPPLVFSVHFMEQLKGVRENVEKIVNIITTMHNESITQSKIYIQNNPQKYYRLFIENNISSIDILYIDPLDRVNIDEKYPYSYNVPTKPYKTIKVEEMQAVITKKDKKIPNYKEHYDQKWLIITNYETIDYFILEGTAKETQYKCNFDKVLYIQMSWIEPKTRKPKRIGSLTDTFDLYELKAELGQEGTQGCKEQK